MAAPPGAADKPLSSPTLLSATFGSPMPGGEVPCSVGGTPIWWDAFSRVGGMAVAGEERVGLALEDFSDIGAGLPGKELAAYFCSRASGGTPVPSRYAFLVPISCL